MAILLSAKDISMEFPAKKVLETVTLGIMEGDRIGIVGKNGDGKSTLLSILSGQKQADSGEVILNGSPTIGVLGQADSFNDSDTVLSAVVGDMPEYEWASDRKIREIIEALIGDVERNALLGTLSGGQRRRIDLARLLIGDWDILMLDEPTNHLDMSTIAWLAQHLQSRWQKNAGALLVITHDRWFLDEVATSMWEVHDGAVEPFEGGYSAYILQRVERDRLAAVSEQKRRNMARKELAWLSRGARARSTKPKFHMEAAQALIADVPPVRNTLELKRAAMTRLGKQVLELVNISEQFGDKLVLNDISWLIGPGDRYGILGENGAGKSTLLNVMRGALLPSSGYLKVGKTVKMATLSQRLDELEEYADERVREILGRHKTRLEIEGKSVTSAQLLERMGFEKEHLNSFVRDLSGGQKRRLQLLLVLVDEPNVLILDEPGNDMDTDMLAVMEDLLDTWPGTMLLVSHDRYLMERVTDDQFALIEGKIRHMTGGVDEYLEIISAHENNIPASKATKPAASSASLSGGELHRLKKELHSIEKKINTAEKKVQKLKDSMDTLDPTDFVALGETQAEVETQQKALAELESAWLEISEQLEQ